jgi:hypothetical protein
MYREISFAMREDNFVITFSIVSLSTTLNSSMRNGLGMTTHPAAVAVSSHSR